MTKTSARAGSRTLAVLITVVATAACGPGETAHGADDASAADRQWTAALAPVGGSGVQGTVRVTPGADSLTVKLELLGVGEGERYPARLTSGGCDEEGSTMAELQTPHVGTVGVGSSLTRIGSDALGEDGDYSVRVALPGGSPAACGELRPGGV